MKTKKNKAKLIAWLIFCAFLMLAGFAALLYSAKDQSVYFLLIGYATIVSGVKNAERKLEEHLRDKALERFKKGE